MAFRPILPELVILLVELLPKPPDLTVLLARLLRDDRVPLARKAIAVAGVAYVLSPLDLLPSLLLGPVGMLDDLMIVAACLSLLPSTLFFIMFLRRIAVYLKRADLRVLAGSMIFPAALGLIFAVTAIVPFINLLTIPITTMFLCITYALFLLLTYRTYRAVVEMDNRTADDDVASQMEQHL